MTLELATYGKQATRKKLIEQAFNHSQHRHYRMPRTPFDAEKQSIEDIPHVYNLYTQNQQNKQSNLLPLKQLIRLNSRFPINSTNSAKKASLVELQNEVSGEDCRKSRIHRTLSKNSSRMQVKQSVGKSWWCCIKDQKIQEFQTKQLTISDDWRYNNLLSPILLQKNRSNRRRLQNN